MSRSEVREMERLLQAGDSKRYTKHEKRHLDDVAERVERDGLAVGEAVRILETAYRLGVLHSRESIRSTLMNYRSEWRRRLHPPSTEPEHRVVTLSVSGDDFRSQGSGPVTAFVDAMETQVRELAKAEGLTVKAVLWACVAVGQR